MRTWTVDFLHERRKLVQRQKAPSQQYHPIYFYTHTRPIMLIQLAPVAYAASASIDYTPKRTENTGQKHCTEGGLDINICWVKHPQLCPALYRTRSSRHQGIMPEKVALLYGDNKPTLPLGKHSEIDPVSSISMSENLFITHMVEIWPMIN
ncbi:hypothetical protein BGX38DRAFT_605852 [Terfezia claveryi]|nr:hypothetical protein BGX38DRAFT_707937 [Terfezia claveryi]KAF8447135.1 hypothetical protein BGX38DRAFT_605852 [Terfezia claveryi]